VKHTLISGYRDGSGSIDHPVEITVGHFTFTDRNDAMRIQAAYVAAGNACIDRVNLTASHQLGFFDRMLDGLHRGFDVDHHTFLQAV